MTGALHYALLMEIVLLLWEALVAREIGRALFKCCLGVFQLKLAQWTAVACFPLDLVVETDTEKSRNVVKILLEAYPDANSQRDMIDGSLPLHHALMRWGFRSVD